MSNDFERGIVIVGQGQIGKTTPTPKDNVVVIGNEPTPYKTPLIPLPPLPQIDITPYWDGKSARHKRREAERNAKKKRK